MQRSNASKSWVDDGRGKNEKTNSNMMAMWSPSLDSDFADFGYFLVPERPRSSLSASTDPRLLVVAT